MKIDVEQFLAVTVALGAIGAAGIGAYTARADASSTTTEVRALETFADGFAREDRRPSPPEHADDAPPLQPPPPPTYADDVELATNDVADPTVETPRW